MTDILQVVGGAILISILVTMPVTLIRNLKRGVASLQETFMDWLATYTISLMYFLAICAGAVGAVMTMEAFQ